ncbi:hypothetical protein G1K73_11900 [Tenacibaculum finnmarkense]|uniref:Het-C domain-containing protein n=1 Tax=Tenacibaculum finnmarkense TaxID=2781243 RepID=UPI001EFBCD52|nr:Het-C domain-containing protein [Tenacibaculum finnmarkense]MCG8894444.1 hypothetical protein [Tenacibaculum finnmarkense]
MGTIFINAKNIIKHVDNDYFSSAKNIEETAEYIVKEAIDDNLEIHSKTTIDLRADKGIFHESFSKEAVKPEKEKKENKEEKKEKKNKEERESKLSNKKEKQEKKEEEEDREIKLSSDFAHEALKQQAVELGEMTFILLMKNIFTKNIKPTAYKKLYKALSNDEIEIPEIKVIKRRLSGRYEAEFKDTDKIIYVWDQLVLDALEDDINKKYKLLSALVEEYGHYIDYLLRYEFSEIKQEDNSFRDAGAIYAYNFFYLDVFEKPLFPFATIQSDAYSGELSIDLTKLHKELSAYVPPYEHFDENATNNTSHNFGAGHVDQTKHPGAFGHGDIENVLITDKKKLPSDGLFKKKQVDGIYYGNWLRDFSQIIVEFTINVTKSGGKLVKHPWIPTTVQDTEEASPVKLSADGLVKVVEILAIKEFVLNKDEEGNKFKSDDRGYYGLLKAYHKKFGMLTKDILGCYRPEEHLDNPWGLVDESSAYSFNNSVGKSTTLYKGRYVKSAPLNLGRKLIGWEDPSLTIITDKSHSHCGLKTYIAKDLEPKVDYPSSLSYLKQEIAQAVAKGENKDGYRHFGNALHVLEDYFAHTNFTEVAIIKVHDYVYPWVETIPETLFNPNKSKDQTLNIFNDSQVIINLNKVKKDIDLSSKEGIQTNPLSSYIPIVTGLFLEPDTLASVAPKIAELLETNFKYEIPPEGDITLGQGLIRVVLEDLVKNQETDTAKGDFSLRGMSYSALLSTFNSLLTFNAWKNKYLRKAEKEDFDPWDYKSWAQEGGLILDEQMSYLLKTLGYIIKFVFVILFEALGGGIQAIQTSAKEDYGTNPTHTQIAKDNPNHPLNPLAGQLAQQAVKDVGLKINAIWAGKQALSGSELGDYIANTYMVHPDYTSVFDNFISEWCDKNKKAIQLAKDKTALERLQKEYHEQLHNTVEKYKKSAKEQFQILKELYNEIIPSK